MNITTAQSISLIAALGALKFRPMGDNDFAAFAGADEDAQIAFSSEMAVTLCDLTGESIMAEGDDAVAIIVSGQHIELNGITPEGDPVCVGLDLSRLI